MTDLPEFRTAPFRAVARKLGERIDAVAYEGIAAAVEAAHLHPYRVGLVHGLREAIKTLAEIEKDLMGDHA